MKMLVTFLSLMVIACSSKQQKEDALARTEVSAIESTYETKEATDANEKRYEEVQDSLRKVLLDAKPNKNLTSSLLQEFYLRGLVIQENDQILFNLPFNLHGLDCGAPDCYSTDISFRIPSNEPIDFPNKIDFKLREYGCVDEEKTIKSTFALKEKSQEYVNYFSEELKSNLMIKRNGELYYYPHLQSRSISIKAIDEMFESGAFDEAEITPFQSTVMTSSEYEHFLKK
jgi:hypothetical protein